MSALTAATRGLDRILAALGVISSAGVWVGGGLLVALSLGVGAEVLLRRFFNHSFGGIDEIGGYVLAVIGAVAFTETLLNRGHIRIDLLRQRLGARGKAFMDLVALLATILFFGLLLYYAWALLSRSMTMNTRSMTPLGVRLWIPQLGWFAGILLFTVTAVTLLLRSVLALAAGDHATSQRLIGARGTDDEVAEELELAAVARGEDTTSGQGERK